MTLDYYSDNNDWWCNDKRRPAMIPKNNNDEKSQHYQQKQQQQQQSEEETYEVEVDQDLVEKVKVNQENKKKTNKTMRIISLKAQDGRNVHFLTLT